MEIGGLTRFSIITANEEDLSSHDEICEEDAYITFLFNPVSLSSLRSITQSQRAFHQ